jgi:hypothetical protein
LLHSLFRPGKAFQYLLNVRMDPGFFRSQLAASCSALLADCEVHLQLQGSLGIAFAQHVGDDVFKTIVAFSL